MFLTIEQIRFILNLISEKYGSGYSEDSFVCSLQIRLSVALQAKMDIESLLDESEEK